MSTTKILRRCFCVWFAVSVLPVISGCGGGSPTQADMMQNAIRRKSNDEDEQPASAIAQAEENASPAPPTVSVEARPSQVAPASQVGSLKETVPVAESVPNNTPADVKLSPDAGGEPSTVVDPAHDAAATARPQTEEQRRQQSIDNMGLIGAALVQHLADKGHLPLPAVCDRAKQPLLSWRVALLPYLGLEDLYRQFNLEQPWDSPRNLALLSNIPDVYRSPEREDERTNYLVPRDSNTLFPGDRAIFKKHVEDGLAHTAMLLEVDDALAVPWTKPTDYPLAFDTPADHLGELRGSEFFVIWADGSVRSVSTSIPTNHWKAMFTIDSGERFSASIVSNPATASVAVHASDSPSETLAGNSETPTATRPSRAENAIANSPVVPPQTPSFRPNPHAAEMGGDPQLPVPPASERRRASQMFSSLYRSEYREAKTDEDKRKLARKMLTQADSLQSDPVGRFVALEVGRKIATESGDLRLALDAAEKTIAEFQVDPLAIKSEVLGATLRRTLSDNDNQAVLKEATTASQQALAANELDVASRLINAALAAARRTRDQKQIGEVVAIKRTIERAELAYTYVLSAIEHLDESPGDPEANLTVGAYFCFVVGRWDDGLPMLAQGGDPGLAEAAELELRPPQTPDDQIAIADLWWELAQQDGRYRSEMAARAARWYERALPLLTAGMQRVKAEVRMQQLER